MQYILSILTTLMLIGAGCASTSITPTSELPVEPPSAPAATQTETPSTSVSTTPSPITTNPTTEPLNKPSSIVAPPSAPTVQSYIMAEIAAANTETNCLTVINDIVYNLTAFINKHPGGDRNILKICGKDGTSAFTGQHGGNLKQEHMLATFNVGVLKK